MAFALIVQADDGSMHIIGSKNVTQSIIEMQQDHHRLDWDMDSPGLYSFRIEAECADLTWQYRACAVETPAIAQRGIYLPDMSFRALPEVG